MTFLAAAGGVLGGILAASAVGFSVSRLFAGDLTRAERTAWSLSTGFLVQSLLFLFCVSVAPGCGPAPVLALDLLVVAIALLIPARGQVSTCHIEGQVSTCHFRSRGVLLLFVVAAAACLLFLVQALAEPMWSTDFLAIWGLKGKTIATAGHVPRRLFDDPALYWAHREYPMLVPLSLATLASFAGGWDDQALALLFPVCELATLFALFGFFKRRVSSFAGAAACALTALCFPLYRAVNAGTAEVPFAFSLVLVSTAFLDSLSDRSPLVLTRLAMASLFCVSTKQEGTIFVLLLAAALWIRRRWDGWALVAPPVVHWGLLYFLGGTQPRREFDFTFLQPFRWPELAHRFTVVLGRILGTESLAAWLSLLAIVLYLLVTRRGLADPLLAVFALQILGYVAAFSISSYGPVWAADAAFSRVVATVFPAFTLVLGARVEKEKAGGSVGDEIRPAVEGATSD
ncbi:MAG TPA: hypothetical protein VGK86_04610 [Thermoanaerobaculia bacterium]|jgi:hypothetical protein